MAGYTHVFSDKQTSNWFKACIALNITKEGLASFVDTEIQKVQQTVGRSCGKCSIENLIKCPTRKICSNTRNCSFHNTQAKQPQPCQVNVCDQVKQNITSMHRFQGPSWQNTHSQLWGTNHWEIAKCFCPPDGYSSLSSAHSTDFNGIISIMLNCKHFDKCMSFAIAPQGHKCALTTAREIGRQVRHTANCNVTDVDLSRYFHILKSLLADPTCLLHDATAANAHTRLQQLEIDTLSISEKELSQLLKEAQETIEKAKLSSEEGGEHISQARNNALVDLNKFLARGKRKLEDATTKGIMGLTLAKKAATSAISTVTKKQMQTLLLATESGKSAIKSSADACLAQLKSVTTEKESNDYQMECQDLYSRLTSHYSSTMSKIPVSPLMPTDDDRNINDIYVQPTIRYATNEKAEDGTRKQMPEVLTYRSLLFKEDQLNRTVFVQGEPGVGKTTFASRIAFDWSSDIQQDQDDEKQEPFTDVENLKSFKFVFFIKLRDSMDKIRILEMIKEQILDILYSDEYEIENAYRLVKKILEKERCLVIQDGLDEWFDKNGKLALPLMTCCNAHCTALFTTRPWKMLDERIKDSNVDMLLDMEGGDSSLLSKRILACLVKKDIDVKYEEFIHYVYDNKLEEIAGSSPMMLTNIACLWFEGTYVKGSLSDVCCILIDSLIKKASDQKGYFYPPPFKCFENTQFTQPCMDIVDVLSKAAFFLLFSNERESAIVFNERELLKYVSIEQKKFALNAGLLSEKKNSALITKPSTCSFLHKTIQEFLASLYLAKNVNGIEEVVSKYLKKFPHAVIDISQVFIYLCGLNPSGAYTLSCFMNDVTSEVNFDDGDSLILQKIILSGYKEAKMSGLSDSDIHLKLTDFTFVPEMRHVFATRHNDVLTCVLNENKANVRFLKFHMFITLPLNIQDIITHSAHSLEYLTAFSPFTSFDLSYCFNLKGLDIRGQVMLPNTRDLKNLKCLSLLTNFNGLDLSPCTNIETITLGERVSLINNGLDNLTKLKSLTIFGRCDRLNLAQCDDLDTLILGEHVSLMPIFLREYPNLRCLSIQGSCESVDISLCPSNIETITLGENVTLVPNPPGELLRLKSLLLYGQCKRLDLSSCHNLEKLILSPRVSWSPNTEDLINLKILSLFGSYTDLDLSPCQLLKMVHLGKSVSLLANTFCDLTHLKMLIIRGPCEGLDSKTMTKLTELENITLLGCCKGLDLSQCMNLQTLELGTEVSLCNNLPDLSQVESLILNCKCNSLDLRSCKGLKTLNLGEQVTLASNSLPELTELKCLILKCCYNKLNLATCCKLETLNLAACVSIVPHSLTKLSNVTYLELHEYIGIDLTSCKYLETLSLGEMVTVLPNKLPYLIKLKSLSLKCPFVSLDLSGCFNLVSLVLGGRVSFVATTLRGLTNLRRLQLHDNNNVFQMWFTINSLNTIKDEGFPLPPSLEIIELSGLKCSAAWLRSLLVTLSTFNHPVQCKIFDCDIPSHDEFQQSRLTCSAFQDSIVVHDMSNITLICTPDSIGFYEALTGATVKKLIIANVQNSAILLHSMTSLPVLENLWIASKEYTYIPLQNTVIKAFFIYESLQPMSLRHLVEQLDNMKRPLDCSILFGIRDTVDDFTSFKNELDLLERIHVQAYRITDNTNLTDDSDSVEDRILIGKTFDLPENIIRLRIIFS